MNLISLQNVSVSFKNRIILNSLNFEIPDNSVISISGKSGSGKTTLLSMISGLLKPDSGTVLFRNKNIYKWMDIKRSGYRNKKIGYIFQSFNLIPELTIYQNIIYSAVLNKKSSKIKQSTNELMEQLNIIDIKDQKPYSVSGGEKQRTAIARALINKPEIILADEPTGNLDTDTSKSIFRLFRKIQKESGISFLITTHDSTIIRNSDMHYSMESGNLKNKKVNTVTKNKK